MGDKFSEVLSANEWVDLIEIWNVVASIHCQKVAEIAKRFICYSSKFIS